MKITKQLAQDLVSMSVKTMHNSYSPYSKYKVGAAVVGGSGKIYTGTNVENASYGLTVCAERIAIFNAIANGETEIKAIALASKQKNLDNINGPCGACRQVMAEFGLADMPVYTADIIDNKVARITTKKLKDFYPMPFTPKNLQDSKAKTGGKKAKK